MFPELSLCFSALGNKADLMLFYYILRILSLLYSVYALMFKDCPVICINFTFSHYGYRSTAAGFSLDTAPLYGPTRNQDIFPLSGTLSLVFSEEAGQIIAFRGIMSCFAHTRLTDFKQSETYSVDTYPKVPFCQEKRDMNKANNALSPDLLSGFSRTANETLLINWPSWSRTKCVRKRVSQAC